MKGISLKKKTKTKPNLLFATAHPAFPPTWEVEMKDSDFEFSLGRRGIL
jgi:hypothetical protein